MVIRALIAGIGVYSVYLGLQLGLGTDCSHVGFSLESAPALFECASQNTVDFTINRLLAALGHVIVGLGIVLAAVRPALETYVRGRPFKRAARIHAARLAAATGVPARRIVREIVGRRLTPGDWADEHGLDPITFDRRRADGG